MKGARITVKCDCGRVNYLLYGERWQCEDCGRRWNTTQIPSEEYWGLMRAMRAERVKVMIAALAVGALFVILGAAISTAFFFCLPLAFSGWYLMYMPRWRARLRQKARAAPTWNLRPE